MKMAVLVYILLSLLVLQRDLLVLVKSKEEDLNNHQKLAEWVTGNGGVIKFEITQLCPTCVRGAYATEDIKKGDMIARVPFNVSIKMPADVDYAGGHAYELLTKMHKDPDFNTTYGLFWSTQPTPEDVFAPETYNDLHIKELQSKFSKSHTEGMKRVTMQYYDGTYGEGEDAKFSKPINEVIAPHSVDVDTFLYLSALIVTREFEFDVGGEDCVYLFPSIDMLNDCLKKDCNVDRINNDEYVKLVALKDIKKGEQLTMAYQSEVTHRPDMSLLVYGFTMPSDPPLMAAQDLVDFQTSNPFKSTAFKDDEYRPKSRDLLVKEIARCRAILDGFATTAEEDEALLKNGKWDGPGEWKMQEVIKSRLARKRGLMYHVEEMTDTLSEL